MFTWPCARRDAHHAHVIPCEEIGCPEDGCSDVDHDCRGVKAHPNTMIGRAG